MSPASDAATVAGGNAAIVVFDLACDGGVKAAAAGAGEKPGAEWTEPLLRRNAIWFCRLRWVVVGVLAAVAMAGWLLGGRGEGWGWRITPGVPLVAAVGLTGLNLWFARWRREGRSVAWGLWVQIVADLLVLTVVIQWLGRGLPAAPFMYLFHVILACIVFPPGASLGVTGLAAAFYLMALFLEAWGGVPTSGGVVGMGSGARGEMSGAFLGMAVLPMLMIWGVIWYLVSRLAEALRERDRALFVTNLRLLASIEERSKHMLQTTHQLKAPFAAIHAQAQLLTGGFCGALPDKARGVVEKISDRCLVLSRQIQEMLQLANLRSQGQTTPPAKELWLDRLIEEVVTRVEPAAQQRGIRWERAMEPVRIQAVEDHVTMLVDNLVVNAVTYSYPQGRVWIECRAEAKGGGVFVVRDEGIGIPREKLPKVFDDYYRTEEAVQHNRGSTGLGLAIVRQVACEDHWSVRVESAPGWGTQFTVRIPGEAR